MRSSAGPGRPIRVMGVLAVLLSLGVTGCSSSDSTDADELPFAGSWVLTNPDTGATYLRVIEQVPDGFVASFYTDQAEWCDGLPYRSEFSVEVIDDVTLRTTGTSNQCSGGQEFVNDFAVSDLVFDPATDTHRDMADPPGWEYRRDSSIEPGDLYPSEGT